MTMVPSAGGEPATTPPSGRLSAGVRELIKSVLSDAGAYCGECGFEPGDRLKCRDCERCWDRYADALAPLFDATPEGLAAALAESGRKTAEIERMRAEHERESMELIEERDNREEWADRLADAVGPIELIGEHSSGNNPWANALDLITPHAEVKRLKAEVARQAREIERLTADAADFEMLTGQQCENGKHPDWAVDSENNHRCPWCRIAKLESELAKYVGKEPTLAEEAQYRHEQQVWARIAQDVNRAERPVFAKGEEPEIVVKVTRAIDIRLIEMGPAAPYWVPEGGAS